MFTSDNHRTSSRLLTLLDKICIRETLALVRGFELLSEVIVAYASGKYDGVGGEYILQNKCSKSTENHRQRGKTVLQHPEQHFGRPLQQHMLLCNP
jgi:hypothetical protein